MNSGIYLIQNKANGKVYVGSAVNIKKRWADHKHYLRKGRHHSQRLQHSWNKHGEENFEFSVIEHCEPENLIKLEQFMLDLLCSYEDDKGYNICPTAGSPMFGRTHSEETKRKISEAKKGNKNSLGITRSEETKRKIRESQNPKGYSFHKATGKYRAQIRINGKLKSLGYYNTPEEARAAYLNALNKVQQDGLHKAREAIYNTLGVK